MKIAPPSADLLIKLALVALVVGGGVYLVRRASGAIGDALPDVGGWIDSAVDAVGNATDSAVDTFYEAENWSRNIHDEWREGIGLGVDYGVRQVQTSLNPASTDNLIYRGVNAIGSKATGTADFSLGSWIYDLVNPAPVFTPFNPDPVQDIRRIDNALGY